MPRMNAIETIEFAQITPDPAVMGAKPGIGGEEG